MPQILWSMSAAPRFHVRDVLCGRYKIQKIVKEDKVSQIVYAVNRVGGATRVVRILTRATVKEKDVMDEIAWIQRACASREEFSRYVEYHMDARYLYVVFEKCSRTLKDVINDADLHISRRHIVEILIQMARAVQFLNDNFIFDMDICPENFEVVEDDTIEWFYCASVGDFKNRKILSSTKIRYTFYGRSGKPSSVKTMTEQYKSPEHVYDMHIAGPSNVFSVGLVLGELLTRKPLLPPCPPGRLYIREKSVAYDAVLGPFPDNMVQDIRRSFRGVFKYDDSDFPEVDGISMAIREFCEESQPLRYTILEEYASDIVECMTRLDPSGRVSLRDILYHPFMDVSSL